MYCAKLPRLAYVTFTGGPKMAQAKVYTLDEFVQDVGQVFSDHNDPRAQAQKVSKHLSGLLKVPDSLEGRLDPPTDGEFTMQNLHLDKDRGHPSPGFLVMVSTLAAGWGNVPHDHGTIWVVYGVYKGSIQQTKYQWVYPEGEWTAPQFTVIQKFIQKPGEISFFLPGEIHDTSNASTERSLVVRVESRSLEGHWRHMYNLENNAAVASTSAAPPPAE